MTRNLATDLVVSGHTRGSTFALTVAPRSATNRLDVQADGTLRARITAPPVDGAANAALLRLLAERLELPRSRLAIVTGETGRRKRILVEGIAPEDLANRLARALDER